MKSNMMDNLKEAMKSKIIQIKSNPTSDRANKEKASRANSILGGDRGALNASHTSSLSDDFEKTFVSISKIDTYDEARKEKLREAKEKFKDWKA